MSDHGYGGAKPIEALRLVVHGDDGGRLGELFLAHGHQGSADSDRYARFSRFLVHRGWRPLQRWLNRPWNTPSVDWDLRGKHAAEMEAWAHERRRVLIAGHTHLPVFFDEAKQPVGAPAEEATSDDALRLAWSEWARADRVRLNHQRPEPLATPCYFNTGCCAFGDGDITGIEIEGGEIRLIRWPSDAKTDRHVLAQKRLEDVFRLAGA